jgi:hypothetical protein
VLPQRLGNRQVVDFAIALKELSHRSEDGPVLFAVEVLGPQLLLDQKGVQVALVEQNRAEDGLLGLEIVRRNRDWLGDAHGDPNLASRAASA